MSHHGDIDLYMSVICMYMSMILYWDDIDQIEDDIDPREDETDLREEEMDCIVTLRPTFASSGHPVPMYTWTLSLAW